MSVLRTVDVSGDGGIIKEVLREGTGDVPSSGAKIEAHYTGTLMDGTKFDSSRDRGDTFKFDLGQGRVIKGWDQGFATMKKGEHAVLICKSDYAYGEAGAGADIPGGATLKFDVELIDFHMPGLRDRPKNGLTSSQKIEVATEMKEEAKAYFMAKDFIPAAKRYGEAIEYSEEVETEAGKELTVTLVLNQAMAYVKSGAEAKDAIACATRVIDQPEHAAKGAVVKAYYWRAMAYFNLNEYGKCKKDCVAAAKIDNGNKSVRKLHKKAMKAAKSSKAQMKKLYKGVFDKASMYDDGAKPAKIAKIEKDDVVPETSEPPLPPAATAATAATAVVDKVPNKPVSDGKVPVTVLTGFLGSGKTTLLNYLLTQPHGKKLAIIENEFGEVGIDDALIAKNAKMQTDEQIIEMMNGCICCTVRKDLVVVLQKLRTRIEGGTLKLDGIIIETTGMADPAPVAQTFFVEKEVAKFARLDGIITVVDAKHIEQHLDEVKPAGAENEAIEQVAFADRLILNKIDLVSEADLERIEGRLKSINRFAPIKRSSQSQVSVDSVLDIRGFDLKRTLEMDPEFLDTEAEHEHDSTVTSLSITQAGEVHMSLVNAWVDHILKTKGTDIYRMKGVLSVSGSKEKFVYQAVHMIFDGRFDEPWAAGENRTNKLVFIGKNLDRDELNGGFAGCIVNAANQQKIQAIEKMEMADRLGGDLLGAARRDDVFMLKRLIGAGVSPSFGNSAGQTALHIACIWANTTAVQTLIAAGADLNKHNDLSGETPLHMCARFERAGIERRLECTRLLVKAGADLRSTNMRDEMPYQCVSGKDKKAVEEMIKLLTPS